MTRRRTSFPIRCWQMIATALVVLGAFAAIGTVPRLIVWLLSRG